MHMNLYTEEALGYFVFSEETGNLVKFTWALTASVFPQPTFSHMALALPTALFVKDLTPAVGLRLLFLVIHVRT